MSLARPVVGVISKKQELHIQVQIWQVNNRQSQCDGLHYSTRGSETFFPPAYMRLLPGKAPSTVFQLFMDQSGKKSLDTGKTVLILVNLPSCQWYVSSKRRYSSAKWQKFTDVCTVGVGGGGARLCLPPTIQTSLKFGDFEELCLC